MKRLLSFLIITIGGCLFFNTEMVSAQLIKYCSTVGSIVGVTTNCASSCGGTEINVATMSSYVPADKQYIMNSLCSEGEVCCAQRGDALCSKATALASLSGSCAASCGSGMESLSSKMSGTPELCSTGSCCVPSAEGVQVKPLAESGSTKLSGLTKGVSASPSANTSPEIAEPGYGLINPLGARSIPTLMADLIKWLSGIAGTFFTLYLLWGGFEWMTAGGNSKKTEAARSRIIYSILGIVVIFTAYFIIEALITVTNISF